MGIKHSHLVYLTYERGQKYVPIKNASLLYFTLLKFKQKWYDKWSKSSEANYKTTEQLSNADN